MNPRVLLVAIEEEVVETPVEEEEIPTETEEVPTSLAETFIEALPVEGAQQILESIRNLPGVEEAAEISTPALAFTAGASVVILAIAFDFLPFLQYLFTAPVLFFWRYRRKGYGVVYNAISKAPIDLAVVRLFKINHEATDARGRLIQSRVTDTGGRYFFLVQPGKYRIAISKPGFQFPSDYLKDEKIDGPFLDVYHGEIIEVTTQNAVVTVNIPLDPSQAATYHEPSAIRRRKFLRGTQHTVAIVGVVAAVVFAIIRPTVFSVGMVVVQGGVYLLVRRLARPHKPIGWGIVYDRQTGRPLSRVVARIFEPKYNKLLETQVTDSKGRYAFMLGPNQYFATFQKNGFKQKTIDPIDYSQSSEPKGFSEKIPLEAEDSPSQ
ncbi:carboxypeptidase regulatory-like domain-containing protein [Patescibacteria group bacterium]|nr:MAG: carboxypeptidase regulatory-like domain-containing protein [Patescibacteria group bacterium]